MILRLRKQLSRIRERAHPIDVVLALALCAVGEAEIVLSLVKYPGPPILAAAMVAWSTLPIVFRRIAPLGFIALIVAGVVPHLLRFGSVNSFGPMLALLVGAYTVGQIPARRDAAIGAAIVAFAIAVQGLTAIRTFGLGDWLFVALIFGGTFFLGRALAAQGRRAEALAGETERLRRDRDTAIEGAITAERARIARELHDVVAHNVGLIVLQAGGGRSVLATEPGRALEALRAIEATGRQTLLELRRLVGIVRDADVSETRDPLPGLKQIDALLDQIRATGLDVEVRTEGGARSLEPGVDLAAYRIVQEALTNVRFHAAANHVEVVLRFRPRTLELRVADDGRGPSDDTQDGVGHGLIGMRERALVYGGTFTAGARPEGGFEVRATLPTTADG